MFQLNALEHVLSRIISLSLHQVRMHQMLETRTFVLHENCTDTDSEFNLREISHTLLWAHRIDGQTTLSFLVVCESRGTKEFSHYLNIDSSFRLYYVLFSSLEFHFQWNIRIQQRKNFWSDDKTVVENTLSLSALSIFFSDILPQSQIVEDPLNRFQRNCLCVYCNVDVRSSYRQRPVHQI